MDGISWPLTSNMIRRNSVAHTFGMVRKYPDGTPKPHQGWDFYALPFTPCHAIADGKVVFAGDSGKLGRLVLIEFDHQDQTRYAVYAHLHQPLVRVGQQVARKQKVALTGNTGNAVSMRGLDQHLHFEIRTRSFPGRGLSGRESPITVFGRCPLLAPVLESFA